MTGRLEVITGPMFSGKSEELLRRLRRAEIAGNKVVVVKPDIDSRYSRKHVVSHAGTKMPALTVSSAGELRTQVFGYQVVGIDEAQFFEDEDFVNQVLMLSILRVVIVSGLDLTYRVEPFYPMPELLAYAEKIDKFTAICHSCGNDATRTQRLVNGKPAPFAGDTIQVGGLDTYEARCRQCFEPA